MRRTKTGTLTQFELEIMRLVWRDEETTVPELQQSLEKMARPVALPTIRTMLGILNPPYAQVGMVAFPPVQTTAGDEEVTVSVPATKVKV